MLAPCWPYVGSFFALRCLFFALGCFLCTLWALLARLGRFFGVLECSGVDFGWFGEVLGRALETPEMYFSRLFHIFTLGLLKRRDPYKTLAGAVKIKVCAVTPCTEIDRKSYPGPFRTKVPAKNVSKMHRGAHQDRF